MGSLRQLGQRRLQGEEFETVGTEKASGQGV